MVSKPEPDRGAEQERDGRGEDSENDRPRVAGEKVFDFRAPSFTLRPWKRTLSASDSRPTPGGPKATSYQSTKSHQCVIAADAAGVASLHMKPINRSTASLFTTSTSNPNLEERVKSLKSSMSRRSFLGTSLAVGAGTLGAGLLATAPTARAKDKDKDKDKGGGLTKGDAAILRFLAAAEIIETDLWQQYNELAGIQDSEVPGGSGNPALHRGGRSVG
jgi:hypothetical protein